MIYGARVIGSIFAGKLASVGYNVTVLARNQRYEDMTANGIILQNAYSDRKEVSKVRVIDHLEPSDVYDYILVIMQKTQVNSVLPYLAKNQSENIVFVVNNPLGYEE
ncbi:2-dehydropantoate 2-reductase N-terminal domain-containing protein [Paenibacillus sp. FSL K6-3166]|uniref:ketopantoate reductase family protein n=1 Tax=Paenibacillus sp. FSL K6-3166 TaxID=2921492 RepID=UPI0030F8238F